MIFPLRALLRRNNPATMTVMLIVINVLIFLWEFTQTPYQHMVFENHYAMVPDHLRVASLFTSMFLHAGWLHILGNMWFLWVFGSHIEDVMGAPRFLLFYVTCGLVASAVQLVTSLGSPAHVVGASGAIAGIMGAFLVLYPRIRVRTLIFVFFIFYLEIPAAFILVYWFVLQLINGFASAHNFSDSGGVAVFAHIGGFLTGLFLIRLFPNTRRYFY